MDMTMYNAIKAAMKEGKSVDDVIAEVDEMITEAKKELTPKTTLHDQYRKCIAHECLCDAHGGVSKDALISVLCCYFVQNGFAPDLCFGSNDEFRKEVSEFLDRCLAVLKVTANVAKREADGATPDEMLDTLFGGMGAIIKDMFGTWAN